VSVVRARQGRDGEPVYQAWLVDLDGTLYYQSAVRLAMALEVALGGWSAISCIRAFREEHERLHRDTPEPLGDPFLTQIQRTAARLGRSHEDMRRLIEHWMIVRPCRWLRPLRRRGLLREIDDFHREGGKTALVSDYPARAKLEAMGIAHLFDVVVASGESAGLSRLKPWPDGYLLAAGALGVPPRACLVIGDRVDADGQAARRAGMAFRRV
jgi:beta-phosphoglucomutase-like phosphatase (HAD superfamily)